MRLCIDTVAYSNFRRGHPAAVDSIDSARHLVMPSIVLGELRAGFRAGHRRERNESELAAFLAEPVVEVATVDDDVARIYGELWAALRSAGTPIPTNDVWIAAVTLRAGATLLTFDRHFEKVTRLGVHILDA